MTREERMIWARIRNKQLGHRFLRQYSISNYIVDFYCPKLLLAIELDGRHHTEVDVNLYDQDRTKYINDLGIRILRFWNDDVAKNIDAVISKIISHCSFP